MRAVALITLALLAPACADRAPAPSPTPPPARSQEGALQIHVDPNPIIAIPVADSTFEFPFTLAIRETGGSPVTIDRVGIDVLSVGGLKVYSSELGPAEIERRGYRRTLAAYGEARYSMRPRQNVPDERLFGSLWGELWAEATDANGKKISTRTRVTLRRAA